MRSRITKLIQRVRVFGGRPYVRVAGGSHRWLYKQRIEVDRTVSPPRFALYATPLTASLNRHLARAPRPEALLVTQMGRFGNSFQQICNAVRLAHSTGVKQLYLEPTHWLKTEFGTSVGVRVRQLSGAGNPVIRGGQLGVGRFLWGHEFSYARLPLTEAQIATELRKNLSFHPRSKEFGERDLVIHLRGGDVYSSDPPRDYGQPPAGFYEHVIGIFPWASVTVIYEDEKPVTLQHLVEFARTAGCPFRFQSGSLEDDLAVLLAAKNLVVGNGSFGRAICQLSCDLKTVYRLKGTHPLGELAPPKTEKLVIDSQGFFFENVLQRNWTNSDQQRDLMLSYQAAHFKIEAKSEIAKVCTKGEKQL